WPWEAPVRVVSEALARGDRTLAEGAWRDAWGAALGARRWEGMAAAGALAPRMGGASRAPEAGLVAPVHAPAQRCVPVVPGAGGPDGGGPVLASRRRHTGHRRSGAPYRARTPESPCRTCRHFVESAVSLSRRY